MKYICFTARMMNMNKQTRFMNQLKMQWSLLDDNLESSLANGQLPMRSTRSRLLLC